MKHRTKVSLAAMTVFGLAAAAHAEPMKLEGTVTDVIGRRVIVQGPDGKVLVDLGPRATNQTALKSGDKIVVDGDMRKGDQLLARQVTTTDGQSYVIRRKTGWMDWLTGRKPPPPQAFTATEARAVAIKQGYTLTSEPMSEKAHFVANATKDGKPFEVDIHRDGKVVANPPFGAADARKLATDKGYTLKGDPVRKDKHFVAAAEKAGKMYQLDLHRDGNVVEKAAFAAGDARKLGSAKGYEIVGDPKPDKEHFQMLGRKDGKYYALDAHRDGNLKVLGAVDKSDIKWGPMIPN